MIFFKII